MPHSMTAAEIFTDVSSGPLPNTDLCMCWVKMSMRLGKELPEISRQNFLEYGARNSLCFTH